LANNKKKISVIILAAGDSARMGKPKHELLFGEGKTFLEHIVLVYKRLGVEELIIVESDKSFILPEMFMQPEGIRGITNHNAAKGRFTSVQLGLKHSRFDTFIHNVDNPFVNLGLLLSLVMGLKEYDLAVPVFESKGGHPVFVSKKITASICNDFSENEKLNEVFKNFNRIDIPVKDPYVLVNINTIADYNKYFSGLGNGESH
jgi:CTP:molybdopterin cytidylyltransferase MocA